MFTQVSEEMQRVVKEMSAIVTDETADPDDREAALVTLLEVIYGSDHDSGATRRGAPKPRFPA